MGNNSMILWLFAFTAIAAIGIGIWQFSKVQKSKKTGSHSAITQRSPEKRFGDNAPGVPPRR